jgi:hypothetical protein
MLTVINRVFEAGEGWLNAGRSERSRDSGGDLRALLDGLEEVETGGVEVSVAMVLMVQRELAARFFVFLGCVRKAENG